MRKYDTKYRVSRGVFSSTYDSELKPWIEPKPTPADCSSGVYHRLFEDFNRRQEAKKRLNSILDYKEKHNRETFSPAINGKKKALRRSMSKPQVDKMIERLHIFWDNKWMKIENKKKLLMEIEEKEFQKKRIQSARSDPEAFKRLITPRAVLSPQSKNEVKKFSIREAIESGKRLMKNRLVGVIPQEQSPRLKKFQNEIRKTGENEFGSPSKLSRPISQEKYLDEIINRCKSKALKLDGKVSNHRSNLFSISSTHNIQLDPQPNCCS